MITGLTGESYAYPGYPYHSNVIIENKGDQTSGINFVSIFLSDKITQGDPISLGTLSLDPIRAGSNQTVPFIITVPVQINPGYYVLYSYIHKSGITSVDLIKPGAIVRLATPIEIRKKELPNQTDLEKKIVSLIYNQTNDFRRQEDLKELEWDEKLADIANQYARVIGKAGFLSHTDKSGNGPSERAGAAGYPTTKEIEGGTRMGIGENLAYIGTGMVIGAGYVDPTSANAIASAIMNGWMKSPGHKRNILDPHADRFGAGLFWNGEYYYAVQEFW